MVTDSSMVTGSSILLNLSFFMPLWAEKLIVWIFFSFFLTYLTCSFWNFVFCSSQKNVIPCILELRLSSSTLAGQGDLWCLSSFGFTSMVLLNDFLKTHCKSPPCLISHFEFSLHLSLNDGFFHQWCLEKTFWHVREFFRLARWPPGYKFARRIKLRRVLTG